MTLDCSSVRSEEALAEILSRDFPMNSFYEFHLRWAWGIDFFFSNQFFDKTFEVVIPIHRAGF